MNRRFSDIAWEEFMQWVAEDRKKAEKIADLLDDIERNGISKGIGKPEALKYQYSGQWSRRIDDMNRLVYTIDENGYIYVISCKGHYGDK
ncbi:MAG: Txe/YoeB family addiction module toxin [Selenomonadaceae bacterium]|nr:Txe/YoeB family addiction module toxin [Selenomonadaceae bacterium]